MNAPFTPTTAVAPLIAVPSEEKRIEFYTGGEATARPMLNWVRDHIDQFQGDASTEEGRKAIKSFVYRIVRTRTLIDDAGKELNAKQKEIPKQIDATRKLIRDTLEAWEAEVRAPVTEWEAAEQKRVDAIKGRLAELQQIIADMREWPSETLRGFLGSISKDVYTDENFGEYLHAAIELRDQAIARLNDRIPAAEQRERDKAELESLRAEKAKMEAAERDERLRQEGIRAAEAKAKAEAQKAVQDQLDAAAKREADAQRERDEQAARATKAEELAAAEKLRAQQAEEAAKRAAAPAPRVDVANATDAQREAIAKINREARNALVVAGIDVATAQKVIELIARRKVPNVTINYDI